jgi:hypothetical protein
MFGCGTHEDPRLCHAEPAALPPGLSGELARECTRVLRRAAGLSADLRKGRFDEIFFVDLPQASVRGEIFVMHSARRKLDPASFDLPALAAASDGFSGAEIEQTIVSSLCDDDGNGTRRIRRPCSMR